MNKFRELKHNVDLCIVGGGMSGLCASIAAARHGAKVALIHDRPVFGGNASSECRVHIGGADRHNSIKNMRETGILEELRLENLYRNTNRNYSIWDAVLYEKIMAEENITPLLNCSCMDASTEGNSIGSVTGWQLTTQTYHRVSAPLFADCSGDGILAPLTGARCRIGREAQSEYGESIAPQKADDKTMGMTCLFKSREYETPQHFEPPERAYRFDSCEELPYGAKDHTHLDMGYWWIELGGEDDSIHDTEKIRDELLKIVYGVWDHIKNRCPRKDEAAFRALDWLQFLPAKRESRRFIGDHVLTQNDIESEGRFEDLVAYGGWSMDDHHPAGFNAVKIGSPATIFHRAPSPYGIPYRCLYSHNIDNLMFAGRNASCTHAAMSSTRVMGTCCSMGQAMGTAAAIAVRDTLKPAEITEKRIEELQQTLLKDDAYLPWIPLEMPALTREAKLEASSGDPEPVRDGTNRPVGDNQHCWHCEARDWIAYHFDNQVHIGNVTLILDTALDSDIALSGFKKGDQLTSPPDSMPRTFRIEVLEGGNWQLHTRIEKNCRRLCRLPVSCKTEGIRFVLEETWGSETSCLYGFYAEEN